MKVNHKQNINIISNELRENTKMLINHIIWSLFVSSTCTVSSSMWESIYEQAGRSVRKLL